MKRIRRVIGLCSITLGTGILVLASVPGAASGQGGPGTENGEWRYLGGDAWHTRYSPVDQINAENFRTNRTGDGFHIYIFVIHVSFLVFRY